MHLLVPGAYRRGTYEENLAEAQRLNAPSGAGCLPTGPQDRGLTGRFRLNAPSGAGCLPTCRGVYRLCPRSVSMHLLVPGAYRLATVLLSANPSTGLNAPSGAGCLPT